MADVLRQEALWTAERLFELPDDDHQYELIDGALKRMSPTGRRHGEITLRISMALGGHVAAHQLGVVCAAETGFVVQRNPDVVLAPDVSFVLQERVGPSADEEGYWQLAPDLAVEVLSPSDRAGDVMLKVTRYLAAGTRMVWVVSPQTRTVTVYRSLKEVRVLTEEEVLEGGDVLPGFMYALADLFG